MAAPLLLPAPAGPPLSQLAAALPDERHPVLLQGGGPPSRWNAWSYLLFDPLELLVRRAGEGPGTAFEALEAALRRSWPDARPPERSGGVDEPDALPAFRGGCAGWLAYELGRELERLPSRAAPDADVPDLHLGLYDVALAEQAGTGRRLLVGRASETRGRQVLDELAGLATRAAPLPRPPRPTGPVTSTFTRAAYEAAVRAAREHILDGDVYQVNLSQRLAVPYPGRPEPLAAALAERFPAPFAALLRAPGLALVSSSPELFLRRRGTAVLSRPIKGTRPRGTTPAQDATLRRELESSEKERAELAMIVDLVRNDLGRSARLGSVRVAGDFETDAWSTVFHRVAEVRCEVAPELPASRLVAAAFPPASVTGTPKIRACEVIDELEPVRRHVFTGAIGWIGADGDLDLSVAIRIGTLAGGRLLFNVGGGITLASEPAAEYDETLHKARALLDVLGAPPELAT
ncbi:MAG TPA: anthranilate synthase component I family protein [Planctomycetota bacterium]|nr:anthranilate synthase component I family protein [Planctomycetota bacterium]